MSSRDYPALLTFQSRTLTTQADGQVTESFANAFTRFGKVEQTGAAEATKNDQLQTAETYRIELPRDSSSNGLTSAWRVLWRNQSNETKTLNLTGVQLVVMGRTPKILLTATR